MQKLTAWDIVVVPFPYTDKNSNKRRPALVVCKTDLIETYDHVWLAMITSAKQSHWPCDIAIEDHAACGLPAPSVIRPVKITTLDKSIIVRKIGSLKTADRKRAAGTISQFLAQ